MTYIQMQEEIVDNAKEIVAITADIDILDRDHQMLSATISFATENIENKWSSFMQLYKATEMLAARGRDTRVIEEKMAKLATQILDQFDTRDSIEGQRYRNETMALGLTDDLDNQKVLKTKLESNLSAVEKAQKDGTNIKTFPIGEITETNILLGVTPLPGKVLVLSPKTETNILH